MKRTLLAVLLALLLPALVGAETKIINMGGSETVTVPGSVSDIYGDSIYLSENWGPELAAQTCAGYTFTAASPGWACTDAPLTFVRTASASNLNITHTGTIHTTGKLYRVSTTVAATANVFGFSAFGTALANKSSATPTVYTGYIVAASSTNFLVTVLATTTGTISAISIKEYVGTGITSTPNPLYIMRTLPEAVENEVGVHIVAKQTGAGGSKTALRIDQIGSGTGSEFPLEIYGDSTAALRVSAAGQVSAASDLLITTTGKTVGTNSANFTVQTHSGSFTGGGAMAAGAVQLVTGTNSRTAGAQNHVSITPTYNQASGTAANTELLVQRTATAVGSGTQTGVYVAMPTTTGNPSANAITVDGALAVMDGSDTWNGINVAPTNADHTGSTNAVNGVNVATITGDGQATETAFKGGQGWDVGVDVYGVNNLYGGPTAATIDHNLQYRVDKTAAAIVSITQSASTAELTSSDSVQSFVLIKPEIANSGTAGYAALDVFVGDGGSGSGAESLIRAQLGGADFATPVTKFDLSSTGAVTNNSQVKSLAFTKTNLTNNSAVDIFTVTLGAGEYIGGNLMYELSSTGGSSDIQVHSGDLTFVCANKGGTITKDIDEVYLAASETVILTAGTFADTWAMKAGDVCTVTLNINSNLSSAVNTVSGKITLMQPKTITLN